MSRYFARIIRALIVTTLGFGGGTGLLVFIALVILKHDVNAFQFAWRAGLIIGLLFALTLVAVWLPLDLTAHLFLAKGLYKEIWELEQNRETIVSGTLKSVMQATRQALLMVPNVKSVSDDMEHLNARAATGISWRSGGEELEVQLVSMGDTSWNVKCTSKSRTKNVVFDYGKNFENVEVFQKQLLEMIKPGARPQ